MDFDVRAQKLADRPFNYTCELKFDGLAISIFYEKGELVKAVTRGDGVKGDDVTDNVRTIRSLAKNLKGDFPERFEVRGEIFMHHKAFDELNKSKSKAVKYKKDTNLLQSELEYELLENNEVINYANNRNSN